MLGKLENFFSMVIGFGIGMWVARNFADNVALSVLVLVAIAVGALGKLVLLASRRSRKL